MTNMRIPRHGRIGKVAKQFIMFMDILDNASPRQLETAERQFGDWDCGEELEYRIVDLLWWYIHEKRREKQWKMS